MQRIKLLYRMCQCLRCDFCRSTREDYKLHSLLGSVGKRVEANFKFPAPPFNHISGICKNLADTWPAATRVHSRGRKREDPGNEVVVSFTVGAVTALHSFPDFRRLPFPVPDSPLHLVTSSCFGTFYKLHRINFNFKTIYNRWVTLWKWL